MKQGKTLSELAAEIERQANARRDFVAPTGELEMVVNPAHWETSDDSRVTDTVAPSRPELRIGDHGRFPIQDHTHGQIAARVKIPKPYYDRMRNEAPELLASNVNHWFAANPERRMVRTLDGRARAFLSDRYRPLDNDVIATALLPVLSDLNVQVASTEITHRRLYLKVTLPNMVREVKQGDPVEFGLMVSNSEIGAGSVNIQPFINRLVCINGMVINDLAYKKYHLGRVVGGGEDTATVFFQTETVQADNKAFVLKLRDTVRGALQEDVFSRIVDRMAESADRPLSGHIEKAVEVVSGKVGLTDSEQGSVLRHLIEGGDLSQWGLANAVTRTAQDDDLTYDRATELEEVGGKIVDLSASDWKEVAEAA